MTPERADILIAGAGPAGLIAAAALAARGYGVVLVDPAPPVDDASKNGTDFRSTAFLQPARRLFEEIGIWQTLTPHAHPLKGLRIVDLAGEPPEFRDERLFRDESGAGALGWNLMNWRIRATLIDHLSAQPNVTLRLGTGVAGLVTRLTEARVTLTDGATISCRLAIAADGRNSSLREAAGIEVVTTRYGQKSLAFTATHDRPHDDISTEIYWQGGPFTMVPLADHDGRPASAIVWMNPGPETDRLSQLPVDALTQEMQRRSAGLFGTIRATSRLTTFPIITQRATALTGQRVAIIAEAAHVLPPIGAQGLNTSVQDIAALLAALEGAEDPGADAVLGRYESARALDIRARAAVIDLFNRVTRSGLPALQSLRLAGLKAAHDIAPLRKTLTRAGMGPA